MRWLLVAALVVLSPLDAENVQASPGPCPFDPTAATTPAVDIGLPVMELCAPLPTEAGPRPTFRWNPVAGAASYQLAVLTTAGEPLWAWTGTAYAVVLGGWTEAPAPDVPGVLLIGPGGWFVVAVDSTGVPIAISPMQPVEP